MRLSSVAGDPGFVSLALIPREYHNQIRIFFDGVEILGAMTADEEQGYILRAKSCPCGGCTLMENGMAMHEELRGEVVIGLGMN
jgi:hypothetical protein